MQHLKKVLVWDIPTRLFHWLLVLAIVAQWATAELGDDFMEWHFYIGYFTLGLIVFRLFWGIVGSRYARFSDFIKSPTTIWRFTTSLFKKTPSNYIGHNPLGGLIVPLVLVLIAMQAITGLFATDDVLYSGPYLSTVSNEWQETLDWLHHKTFDAITLVIVIHLLALIWHKVFLKHNLVAAMFHGKKIARERNAITSSKLGLALVLIVVIGVGIYLLVTLAPPPEEFYF